MGEAPGESSFGLIVEKMGVHCREEEGWSVIYLIETVLVGVNDCYWGDLTS